MHMIKYSATIKNLKRKPIFRDMQEYVGYGILQHITK